MQSPNQLGRLDVRGILVAERPALHPQDEPERLDVPMQVRKREPTGLPLFQIVELERLEIAHQYVTRPIDLRERIKVTASLIVCYGQVAAGAFLLDYQDAKPEQVDETRPVVQLRYMFLIACNPSPPNAEHLEEVVVEALGLS